MGRYLITGACGHKGNVIVRNLNKEGIIPSVLLMPNESDMPLHGLKTEILRGDICDRSFIKDNINEDDTVIHLAGIIDIGGFPEELVKKVNFEGTANITDACCEKGAKKLVYVSTSDIIALSDENAETLKERKDFPEEKMKGAYAESKSKATEYVFENSAKKNLNACVVFPTAIIGPFDYKISEVGQALLNFINYKLLASIDGGYNFVDVRDVANGIISASKIGKSGEGYILSGTKISVTDFIKSMNSATGRFYVPPKFIKGLVLAFADIITKQASKKGTKPIFSRKSIESLSSNCNFSSAKAEEELGFKARDISETVKDSIDWLFDNMPDKICSRAKRERKRYIEKKNK